ncbi:MAG: hypothetical protein P8N52_05420 [Crocinitomicaceae bacterium]|nr:hypothetical protein [Crocinitomicaceae bacterium]MDG1777207.1 hypothetical protein [Crocinitomicaceae bacterium]
MKFLISLFLALFVSQMVVSNIQILNSNSDEKIVSEIHEGEEDDSEKESKNEDTEKDKDYKYINFALIPKVDNQSKLLESHFKQPAFASVYLNTPYPPPDINC